MSLCMPPRRSVLPLPSVRFDLGPGSMAPRHSMNTSTRRPPQQGMGGYDLNHDQPPRSQVARERIPVGRHASATLRPRYRSVPPQCSTHRSKVRRRRAAAPPAFLQRPWRARKPKMTTLGRTPAVGPSPTAAVAHLLDHSRYPSSWAVGARSACRRNQDLPKRERRRESTDTRTLYTVQHLPHGEGR